MVFSGEKVGLFMVNPLEFLDFSSVTHVRSPTRKEKESLFGSASPEPHTLSWAAIVFLGVSRSVSIISVRLYPAAAVH